MLRSKLLLIGMGLVAGLVGGVLLHAFGLIPFYPKTATKGSVQSPNPELAAAPGRWRTARNPAAETSLSEEQKREIRRLESLGYLSGSRPAPSDSGITVYEKTQAFSGLNLVVSGHAPEALLMDMSGDILHTWRCDIERAWPGINLQEIATKQMHHTYWRRAQVMENGDLFAIFERIGLIKLDKQSRLVWAQRNRAHHDLDIAPNGNIYVLTGEAHINKEFNPDKPIWEDYISILDPQGKELKRVSVLEALRNSDFAAVLNKARKAGDLLHTNTIELVEGLPDNSATPFKNGTVLIAIRNLDLVAAVDLDKETVYWAESDLWHHQHQPTLLSNGNMLVFDNNRTKETSAVIELEPQSRQVKWSYIGGRDGVFFSDTCGSCQRLPNGNTLITESDAGRAFEITAEKMIVWEYINPHRAGEKQELIATLFEVVRLQEDFPTDWLQ